MVGVFDVLGPIMIGPSSSHTAGAVRIGRVARAILGDRVSRARILLHGSFADTYRGHGTDRALAAGLLGYATDDERIRQALDIAGREGMELSFERADLGAVHPNTALLFLTSPSGRRVEVMGSSVGGGSIVISRINGFEVELTGEYNTLLTVHQDRKGVIAAVTAILAAADINIAFMRVSRKERGATALMLIEVDQPIAGEVLEEIRALPAVEQAMMIEPQ